MIRDAVFLAGLALVATGLYGVDWRLAATAMGVFLVWLGLIWSKGNK